MSKPTAGNTPTATAVIQFLKACGFQHSRYIESMSSPSGFGFYVTQERGRGPHSVRVIHREGSAGMDARMRKLGITEPGRLPSDPERPARVKEYAEALSCRYAVDVYGGHSITLTARETLPVRPKGVPKADVVMRALVAAGVVQYTNGRIGHEQIVSAANQPDHTRLAVFMEESLPAVREALTAEGWTFEESENIGHYVIRITGSMPDRRERLRKLRIQREARETERAGNAAVAKIEAGIEEWKAEQARQAAEEAAPLGSYVAWAEGPQELTEHGHVVGKRDGEALVMGLDGGFRQMPEDIPEEVPEPAPVAYSRAGVGYRVGMRVTYRDNSGFWRHGEVLKIEPDEEGVRRVHFREDAYQVAPARRAQKHMPNNPGKRREGVVAHTDPMRVVALDDKDLSPERFA